MTTTTFDPKTHSFPTELEFEETELTMGDIIDGIHKRYKAKIKHEFEIVITQEQVVRGLEEWTKEHAERRANDALRAIIMNTAVKFMEGTKHRLSKIGARVYVYRGDLLEYPIVIMTPNQYYEMHKIIVDAFGEEDIGMTYKQMFQNPVVDEEDDDDDSRRKGW